MSEALVEVVYSDGSRCKNGPTRHHKAEWGLIKLDRDGNVVARLYGRVGDKLPQTSPAGEHLAVLAAASLLPWVSEVRSDFKGVADMHVRDRLSLYNSKGFYSGLNMMTLGRANRDFKVIKVPAHVDPESLTRGSDEWFDAVGNQAADEAAKAGALLHADAGQAAAEDWMLEVSALKAFRMYISELPKFWPSRASGKRRKLARTAGAGRGVRFVADVLGPHADAISLPRRGEASAIAARAVAAGSPAPDAAPPPSRCSSC